MGFWANFPAGAREKTVIWDYVGLIRFPLMTPDQLKGYVDAALKQRDTFTILCAIAVPIFSLLAAYFGAYLKEKAKNSATKEDIAEMTAKIEDSKSVYTERLEQLKAELLARSQFSKLRYEREMKIYEDIWPQVSSLREAVKALRPIADAPLKGGETKDSRKQEQGRHYMEADVAFSRAVERNRPFYPQEIWSELRKLIGSKKKRSDDEDADDDRRVDYREKRM